MILIYIHFPWFVISFKSFEDVLMATCILLCQKFIAFFFVCSLVSAYEEIEKDVVNPNLWMLFSLRRQ